MFDKSLFQKNITKNILVFLLFLILTFILTFPLVKNLSTHLSDPIDPALNAWLLNHNYSTFKSFDIKNYFDTNIFYPYKETLLYSETLLSQSLVSFPIFLISGNIIFSYNLLLLLSFTLSAFTAYLLCKYYTKNYLVSITAGLVYGFAAFRFGQIGHLQIITTYFIPLTILYFEKFYKAPTNKNIILFTLFYILMANTSLYHMVFTTIILAFIFAYRFIFDRKSFNFKSFFKRMIIGGVVIGACTIPIYYSYYKFSKSYFIKREIHENILYSADLTSIIVAPNTNKLYGENCALLENISTKSLYCNEKILIPGVMVSLLCLFACISILPSTRKYFTLGITRNKTKLLALAIILICLVIALGPYLKILNKQLNMKMPYFYLYYLFPPAQGIRAPGRIAVVYYLFLGILASYGILKIFKSRIKNLYKYLLIAGINIIVIIEYVSFPIEMRPVFNYKQEVFQYLKKDNNAKVVLHLPMFLHKYGNPTDDTNIMLGATVHNKELINGYSGYSPESHETLTQYLTENFPSQESISILKGLKVDTIVLSKQKPEYSDKLRFTQFSDLAIVFEDEMYVVYRLNIGSHTNGDLEASVMVNHAKANDSYIEVKLTLKTKSELNWTEQNGTPENYNVALYLNEKKIAYSGTKKPLYVLASKPYEKLFHLKFDEKLKQGDKLSLKKENGEIWSEFIIE